VCGWEAFEAARIEAGIPRFGVDMDETNFPQECGIECRAISYQKGCYIGQEIVERVRSRGHVNKLLTALRIDAVEPPSPGTKLSADGTEAGEITSAAFSPAIRKVVALGFLRAQFAAPGSKLKAGNFDAIAGS